MGPGQPAPRSTSGTRRRARSSGTDTVSALPEHRLGTAQRASRGRPCTPHVLRWHDPKKKGKGTPPPPPDGTWPIQPHPNPRRRTPVAIPHPRPWPRAEPCSSATLVQGRGRGGRAVPEPGMEPWSHRDSAADRPRVTAHHCPAAPPGPPRGPASSGPIITNPHKPGAMHRGCTDALSRGKGKWGGLGVGGGASEGEVTPSSPGPSLHVPFYPPHHSS